MNLEKQTDVFMEHFLMNISFIRGGLIFSHDVPINTSILSCFFPYFPINISIDL